MSIEQSDIQRLPREQIREIQNRKLRRQIELCLRGHPYYQRLCATHRLDRDDIQTVEDLHKLPVTSKLDFAGDPEAFRLDIPELPPTERLIWEVMYTTGTTTGQPAIMYTTTYDHYGFLLQTKRASELSGFTPSDRFANVLPMAPFPMGAFVRCHHHAAAIGALMADALPGTPYPDLPVHRSLDEAVTLVERHRCTIIFGVAGFVRRLLIRAREVGADYSSVRMCAVTGEYCSPAMRDDLRRRLTELGAKNPVINDRYGSTEIGLLTQCGEGQPWHNPAPDFVYLEVLEPETYKSLPDGARGLLVMTHLDRRGTVLLRYVVGDVVSMTHEPCPHCGRASERVIGPPVRTKELLKVKGMLVNPDLMKDELMRIHGVEEFQIVFTLRDLADPYSGDELVVRVAPGQRDLAALETEIVTRITHAVAVRPRVVFEERDAIYDPERSSKPERIVDSRPKPILPKTI